MWLVAGLALIIFLSALLAYAASRRNWLSGSGTIGAYVFSSLLAFLLVVVGFGILNASVLNVDEASAEVTEKVAVESFRTNERGRFLLELEDGREMSLGYKDVRCDLTNDGQTYLIIHRRYIGECFMTLSEYSLVTEDVVDDEL